MEAIFDPLNAALGAIPIEAARWVIVGFLLLALVGVCLLRKNYVFLGAKDRVWYADLRLWAILVILPYVLLYLFL